MALDGQALSPKQFKLGFSSEGKIGAGKATMTADDLTFADGGATIVDGSANFLTSGFGVDMYITVSGSNSNDGTYLVTTAAAGTLTCAGETFTSEVNTSNVTIATCYQLINIDSIEMPSFNPTQVFDVRSSDARVAKLSDAYTSQKAVQHEVSFSGTADSTVLPLLLEHMFAVDKEQLSSNPLVNAYDLISSYTPNELEHNATSDIHKTLSVAIFSPEAGNDHSIVMAGVTLTSLTINGDMGTENGRVKISGTFKSGYKPSVGQARPSTRDYGTTYYYLTTMNTKKTVANKADSVLQSLSINMENPSEYLGYQGSDADPQAIARSIPELGVTIDATVKYDDNTADMHDSLLQGTTVATELSNNATFTSATTFGVQASNCKITSVAFNEAAAMMLDVSMKVLAPSSGDMIRIIT
tara:strand:+ start:5520 stop:6758 length:1239 start_codon:yes stop_codon:yes gene_type:complete